MPPFTPWIVLHATSWNESYLNKALHFHSGLKDFCEHARKVNIRRNPCGARHLHRAARSHHRKGASSKAADRAFLFVATGLGV